jgi:hypothetical protein
MKVGSGIGGFEVIKREHQALFERGPEPVSPSFGTLRPTYSISDSESRKL